MKRFLIVLGLTTFFTSYGVAEAPILKTLPSDVQERIEGIRQSCRELGPASSDYSPPRVTKGDEGLITFTVAGMQAVLVDELGFCGSGSECIHGVNCATGFTHEFAIYIRSGKTWKRSFTSFASGPVFLNVEYNTGQFRVAVFSVFRGDLGCPNRPDAPSHIQAKDTCPVILRWTRTRFVTSVLAE